MKHFIGFISFLFAINSAYSFPPSDSLIVFTYDQFIEQVRQHHPLSAAARLQQQKGNALVLSARGGFDPKAYGNIDQKYFEEKTYYNQINAGLKIPTWFGINLNGGFTNNNGLFINPEIYTPTEGLWFAGVSVTLGNGLIIDKRRADLKIAKLFAESNQYMQQLMLNDLYFESSLSYWEWYKAFHSYQLYDEVLKVALQRFVATKRSAELGDRPSIDTLEAYTQIQTIKIALLESELELQQKTNYLSTFLWQDGFIPLELEERVIPENDSSLVAINVDATALINSDSIKYTHPQIMLEQLGLDQQSVEIRLYRENLKPSIDLKYNALNRNVNNDPIFNYNINNYTWGLQASFPLFIRKERGELKLAKLKYQEKEYELLNKIEQIEYKIKNAIANWENSYNLVKVYSDNARNYYQLYEAERTLFFIGESSIFMVNSREQKYIQTKLKLIESQAKNQLAKYFTYYELGRL